MAGRRLGVEYADKREYKYLKQERGLIKANDTVP